RYIFTHFILFTDNISNNQQWFFMCPLLHERAGIIGCYRNSCYLICFCRYSWCLAFAATLCQLTELSVQREELAENLNSQVVFELTRYTQELKAERKTHFQDGRRAQQHIESSWKQLESVSLAFRMIRCEQRFYLRQARQVAQQRKQAAEESRKEYVSSLDQFNQAQHQHYHTLVPVIYQRIQDMEERRIERICEAMRLSAEAEKKVLPVVSRCLDAMMDTAEGIQPRMDTHQVVEVYKSGFEPPGDVEFEDYSASMRRSISESSYLDNRTEGRRQSRKLWPFIRKNKPPPPPPTSPSPGGMANSPQSPPPASREPITQRLNDLMSSGSRTRKQCLRSLKRGGSGHADCSHLPPEQRWKKLQTRIDNINQEIQREREQRYEDALLKMREVYERSPQMGDASSLEPRLEEVKQSLQQLEDELRRNQAWLTEAESRLSGHSGRRQSSERLVVKHHELLLFLCLSRSLLSPDGSYTEDHSAELHFKSRSEFDDDFDDEEPLPSIGTCKSLYPFQGQNEGTLSMVEGELLSVVEEDKGDGWTRVRRNLEEEGYVPTSYIKVFLDSSAKGAMTYI
uniref:Formin binding protein 1a n=1 Tax=Mola mola TaxID=94237 RepID=A0A3Q3XG64_MOLML